jgi:hypothetical protein
LCTLGRVPSATVPRTRSVVLAGRRSVAIFAGVPLAAVFT